ncbi:10948_t:CDS:2, partial [Cetraspora pellucida]
MYGYETFDELRTLVQCYENLNHQISHAINHHVYSGFEILQETDIEIAIEEIYKTSIAYLEPERTK